MRDVSAPEPRSETLSTVHKCFEVLELINITGSISIPEAMRHLNLPRTTMTRIVRTLEQRGYVEREAHRYTLTPGVNRLSHRYSATCAPLAELKHILMKEARTFMWPMQLVLPHADAMYTYLPTDTLTPYKFNAIPAGTRVPYLGTAAGGCYLAYCAAEEQSMIFRLCAEDAAERDISLQDVRRDIEAAQARGYLLKHTASMLSKTRRDIDKRQFIVSVPVMATGRVVGSLTGRVMVAAITKSEIASNIGPRLKDIAHKLGATWDNALVEIHRPAVAAE
jgi:DNA-binding IclR family transcriptional regulator